MPAPDGAEMTKRIPVRVMVRLFNVGKLFADAVQLSLRVDHESSDESVGGFRSDGVEFASEFLREELKCAAHWCCGCEFFVELSDVAGGAFQLLRDIAALGKKGYFRNEARILREQA